MVKQSPTKGGNARIRLIVFEADIPEGDVSQITQALQNALKPPLIQQRVLAASPTVARAETISEGEDFLTPDTLEEDEVTPALKATKESRPRKFPTPKMLDVSPEQAASWIAFAGTKTPKNDWDRHTLAVSWFKDNGADEGVTADHVFTCYRLVKWSVGMEDFGAPLRALKANNFLKSPSRGKYTITQLGIQRVDEMGN